MWLNPIAEQVGYAVVRRWIGAQSVEMVQSAGSGELRTEPIRALRLGEGRVKSVMLDVLVAHAEVWGVEEAKRIERERAAVARREAEAQRRAADALGSTTAAMIGPSTGTRTDTGQPTSTPSRASTGTVPPRDEWAIRHQRSTGQDGACPRV